MVAATVTHKVAASPVCQIGALCWTTHSGGPAIAQRQGRPEQAVARRGSPEGLDQRRHDRR